MSNQRGSTALMVIIIVLLLIIIGGGAYYLFMKKDTTSDASKTSATPSETTTSEETTGNTNTNTVSNQKSAQLINVLDGQGTGTAVHKTVNGKYVLTITTQNLPKSESGKQYVGWIEKKIPFSQIKVGALDKEKDGVFAVEFTSDTDYSLWRFVYVTIENEKDSVTAPTGPKVLDGNWL
ncbi:MAG: hypothetical protein A3F54_02965 [Candidatus Kerfeldbacteria bacterium RIFCSPHIGHO2_12_FULL_48_17]|uniref:Uncharacterized protein n=1 Tax=Candidatus Kerfeldbacteria bacterium RIFCSPHIGHO2_12_FULL_48_17 TaxID=1798542 RepID=A0A1G2B807_9BACT|nr:MAG: hypothetical protein A3F54_02965 [Candidatus Kerfeldbacteria bacterium RIFCSPHIGHO2_12_FULL_48_17]